MREDGGEEEELLMGWLVKLVEVLGKVLLVWVCACLWESARIGIDGYTVTSMDDSWKMFKVPVCIRIYDSYGIRFHINM